MFNKNISFKKNFPNYFYSIQIFKLNFILKYYRKL